MSFVSEPRSPRCKKGQEKVCFLELFSHLGAWQIVITQNILVMMWTMVRTPRDSPDVPVPYKPMILGVLKAPEWMDIEKKKGSGEGHWDVTDA